MAWLLQFIEDWQQSSTFHEECNDELKKRRLISEVITQPDVCAQQWRGRSLPRSVGSN